VFDFLMGYVLGERSARQAASLARSSPLPSRSLSGDLHDVNERVDRLILVVDGMWSLLKDRGYTDAQLRERVEALDAADGHVDGRRTAAPVRCRSCDSMVQAGRPSCAFCGSAVEVPPLDVV
jgi:hypothetical protein